MSLIKKMATGVLVCLLLIFSGTYLITMQNVRSYFIAQLESNAQDTATSLGLSLSQSLGQKDLPMMLAMIDAVFDRGFFSQIEVRDIKDKVLISRKISQSKREAPQWFIDLVKRPIPLQTALVMDGWQQVGKVLVASNTNYAYEALWQNAVRLFQWYLVFVLATLLLVYFFIKSLLKPLTHMTQQALAISENEFPLETDIPKTKELKQVTLAMNQMVLKIKSLFGAQIQQIEMLREQTYQDPLTGLSNRRYFLEQLQELLNNEEEFVPGFVLMLMLEGLGEYNNQYGYQQGDELLQAIAKTCKEFWQAPITSTIARLNGSTIALIDHEQDEDLFDQKCKKFEQVLLQLLGDKSNCKFYLGASAYLLHQTTSEVLVNIDTAVKRAKEAGVYYCQKVYEHYNLPRLLRPKDIKTAIDDKRISLYWQPITDGEEIFHYEVFTRMRGKGNEKIGAGHFMPLAENFGLAHQIDLYVLETLTGQAQWNTNLALNLSKDTLTKESCSEAYLKALKKIPPRLRKRLRLEISESVITNNFQEISNFVKNARKMQVSFGVDRAGISFSPMNYLLELPISYIKLHGSLIQDIEDNKSRQFFIHYFVKLASNLGIEVIATQIEHKEQWQALQQIQIHWGQGRYLGSVDPAF